MEQQIDFFEVLAARMRPVIREEMRQAIQSVMKPEPLPDRINIKEASKVTGLTLPTIYSKVHLGTIPFKKYGSKLVFSRKALLQWMEERTV